MRNPQCNQKGPSQTSCPTSGLGCFCLHHPRSWPRAVGQDWDGTAPWDPSRVGCISPWQDTSPARARLLEPGSPATSSSICPHFPGVLLGWGACPGLHIHPVPATLSTWVSDTPPDVPSMGASWPPATPRSVAQPRARCTPASPTLPTVSRCLSAQHSRDSHGGQRRLFSALSHLQPSPRHQEKMLSWDTLAPPKDPVEAWPPVIW